MISGGNIAHFIQFDCFMGWWYYRKGWSFRRNESSSNYEEVTQEKGLKQEKWRAWFNLEDI
jgi:hypothetical protein